MAAPISKHRQRFLRIDGTRGKLEVVLDRPGLRCRARVSFEWYPDETAHCDWIPSISLVLWIPSYWGLDDTGHITL